VSQTVETETAAVVVPFAANVRFAESDEPVWEETAEMAVSVARSALASWARPERLRCARVVDDSMAPAIRDGDLVVLDAGRTEPLDGQVFVVRTGERVLVKRLRRTDDRWELESDNPAYELRVVTDRDRILGQVAWAGPPSAGHKTQSASGAASGGRST
jgi:phage repressor protein C with HTH and peptisase S24 domain